MKTTSPRHRQIITLALVVILPLLVACGNPSSSTDFTSPQQMIEALEKAGLEAVNTQQMTKDDYGAAPLVATGMRFLIPTLCADCGGRAFVGDPNDIDALRHYYTSMGESSALLFSWVFVSPDGRALLQLNGDLPEEQAMQYQAVIEQP